MKAALLIVGGCVVALALTEGNMVWFIAGLAVAASSMFVEKRRV